MNRKSIEHRRRRGAAIRKNKMIRERFVSGHASSHASKEADRSYVPRRTRLIDTFLDTFFSPNCRGVDKSRSDADTDAAPTVTGQVNDLSKSI